MLQVFIDTLAAEFDIQEEINTKTRGLYQFPLVGGDKIYIADNPPGFLLNSTIAPCPKQNKEAFLEELLFANLLGKGTHGAVLGLDEKGNLLTLSQNVEYTSNYKTFKEQLEDFANTIDFWKQKAIEHT